MKDVAEQLFRRYLEAHPDDYGTINNLVSCVRDQSRPAEAIRDPEGRDQAPAGGRPASGTRSATILSRSKATSPRR